MVIRAASLKAEQCGVRTGMAIADARAALPGLQVIDHIPGLEQKLLCWLAEWCLRFTPIAGIDLPDGLLLDTSGCAHLWGGEERYLGDILAKLRQLGFDCRGGMADTIGAAWAISRYGRTGCIIAPGEQLQAIMPLPPAALRLSSNITEKLQKLGLYEIGNFTKMPRRALHRRFGQQLISRLDQALGQEFEPLQPVQPVQPYAERLPCPEPIRTATGIEIALQQLLEMLCRRLAAEEKGLRRAVFKSYRIDGNVQQITIGTSRPSHNVAHLFRLFDIRISSLEPDLGFELFLLEAPVVESATAAQEALWHSNSVNDDKLAELVDRLVCRLGDRSVFRYLPAEHYWPERSARAAASLDEKPATEWRVDLPRPVHLLPKPEPVEVAVPLPDYPPMHFRYNGMLHRVRKADGPERIEQEWWLQRGEYRDYYAVEDEAGRRYWLFRSGHYGATTPRWFLHGFFA